MRRAFFTFASLLAVVVAAAAIYVASRQNLRFEAPYPALPAGADSVVVARGRYVVRVLAGCASCHSDPADREALLRGEEVALSGGQAWDIPPGKFHAPNITPDPETGIGVVPDSAIARARRHGVRHDGTVLVPFMKLQGLSDQDLHAVVAYLKSQPAVRHPVPAHSLNLLGRIVKATAMSTPVRSTEPPPGVSPSGATVENGRYLVESVMLCGDCHTRMDMRTGGEVGARFAGTTGMPDPGHLEGTWSPPNITAAPGTGRLGTMSEDAFVARFRAGVVIPGTPMPWQAYRQATDDDLRAVYRYLSTVPKAENDVGPPFVKTASR